MAMTLGWRSPVDGPLALHCFETDCRAQLVLSDQGEDGVMIRLAPLAALWLLAGCASDFLDDIEDKAFDSAAAKLSAYCARSAASDLFWQRTRIEVRREIRQRGTDGPPPPDPIPAGLDEQTANGAGPVLMIWCEGETNGQAVPFAVPDAVWRNMIRDWQD
jgi:hypothetical protein